MLSDPLLPLVGGYLLWAALTALVALASWLFAAVYLPGHGAAVRWQSALLVATALVLTAVQGLGAVRALTRTSLALAACSLSGTVIVLAALRARRAARPEVPSLLARRDLALPGALAREAFTTREPLALAALAALVPLALSISIVVLLRSWGWDPVWYHTPITNLAIQEQSLGFVETHDVRAAGQPRVVELLSVWNVLLPRDLALDDAAQLPFALLGALAVAAWTRRLGSTRVQAAGLGACWILAPPVFLQLHSTHTDIAAGALLLTAWVALTGPDFRRPQRWTALGAIALYAGTKQSGLFHGLFLGPLFLGRAVFEVRAARRRGEPLWPFVPEVLLALATLFWLGGGLVYLRNALVWGNPTWPYAARLPLGIALPGPLDPEREWSRPFFLTPGSLAQLVRSWWTLPPLIWPDVRGGGFGPLFRWLTLPCTALVAVGVVLPGRRREAAAIVGLFVAALVVPDAWWPRYALAAPAGALAALAFVRGRLGSPLAGRLVGAAAVALAVAGISEGWPGYHVLNLLGPAAQRNHAERATIRSIDWLWPESGARRRETELRSGDAIAYDDGVYFLGELWARDLRNRVLYLPHPADQRARRQPPSAAEDAAWLARLRAEHAVWAAVGRHSRAEHALASVGAQPLFDVPRSAARVWRLTPPK